MNSSEFNEKYRTYIPEDHTGIDIDNPFLIWWLDNKFTSEFILIDEFSFYQTEDGNNLSTLYINRLSDTQKRCINMMLIKTKTNNLDAYDIKDYIVNKKLTDVETLLKINNIDYRITESDGMDYIVTCDMRSDRFSFILNDGIITYASIS